MTPPAGLLPYTVTTQLWFAGEKEGEMSGNLIRRRRMKLGMTQIDLAEQVGVREHTVQRWEAGAVRPSSEYLLRLAEALDVRVDELLLDGVA
jgi:transcriptional regulator with XRE-family HTH domain